MQADPSSSALHAVVQIGIYTEVLILQVTPVGQTAYGTPCTFLATIVNLATNSHNITFTDSSSTVLCTTPAINDPSLLGATLRFVSPCSGLGLIRVLSGVL